VFVSKGNARQVTIDTSERDRTYLATVRAIVVAQIVALPFNRQTLACYNNGCKTFLMNNKEHDLIVISYNKATEEIDADREILVRKRT
jgi:hypothetical protein